MYKQLSKKTEEWAKKWIYMQNHMLTFALCSLRLSASSIACEMNRERINSKILPLMRMRQWSSTAQHNDFMFYLFLVLKYLENIKNREIKINYSSVCLAFVLRCKCSSYYPLWDVEMWLVCLWVCLCMWIQFLQIVDVARFTLMFCR